uniref:FAM192A/Fyv6 N-terminal domain-containing protein n=2 Tax=Rhizochromulina marina TaxID=1034831 RepID=A0A7S2W1Y8_9STRA|mmetsp:Transcript_1254/g.3927  ORF Transcript_1254/g.3927 Transcript_1254/m.3927 type:complete len:179 (+) Transcript_1254:405-941(+)
MIFAPPKALDDEDIEYLNDAAERDKQRKDLIKAQEDQDLDAFKNARLSRTLHSAETPATPVPAAPSAPAPAPKARDVDVKVKVKVKAKRKITDASGKKRKALKRQDIGANARGGEGPAAVGPVRGEDRSTGDAGGAAEPAQKAKEGDSSKQQHQHQEKDDSNPLSLLGSYDSDSGEED